MFPIATLKSTKTWQPTPIIRYYANLKALLSPDGFTAVAFRFTPQGTGGKWQIDDIYVDPFRAR